MVRYNIIISGYLKKFVDVILEGFDMNNSDCHNEKLKRSDFINTIKVAYIGKQNMKYKTKLEKLITKYVEKFKVIFSITKKGDHFSNTEKNTSWIDV